MMIPGVSLLSFKNGFIGQNIDALIFTPAVLNTIYYDDKSRRYKFKNNNRFVSKSVVKDLIDRKLDQEKSDLIKYSERIKKQEIGVYGDVAKTLKNIHILEAAKIKGFENITQSDLGTIGNNLKKQYYSGKDEITGKQYGIKYLIQEAPTLSDAQLQNRLRMYAESGSISANGVNQSAQIIAGKTTMRRFLSPNHVHCEDCIAYAAAGFQPIGALPLPLTRCRCRTSCKCRVEYY